MNAGMFRKQALSKFLRTDAPGAIVAIAPPTSVVVFATLAALTVALALFAVFGRAQVVAEGRGVARPNQPSIVVRAPFSGSVLVVRAGVHERGVAGETLFELDVRGEAREHAACAAALFGDDEDLAALDGRLTTWNETASKDRDAAMALVLITQLRAQREKVSAERQRCDALATIVDKGRITFPVDAVVLDLAATTGGEVHEGDVLATLSPAGARVVGYLALPEQYRDDVTVGQSVEVKFDSLPYDDVGAGAAHVTRMLDALPSGVRVDGDATTSVVAELSLDSMPGGVPAARSGMTFTADVLTRRPRILALLFGSSDE